MNEKIKLMFNHNENEFGPCIGITRERYEEIKDVVWKVMKNSCGSYKKTQLIETMQDELGGKLIPAEIFVLGISFGVAEYLGSESGNIKELKDMIKEKIREGGEISQILNMEAFVGAMKTEKDDF